MEAVQYYKLQEAAKMLSVTRTTLYRWQKAGKLKFDKIGEQNRISAAELSRFCKQA